MEDSVRQAGKNAHTLRIKLKTDQPQQYNIYKVLELSDVTIMETFIRSTCSNPMLAIRVPLQIRKREAAAVCDKNYHSGRSVSRK